MSSTEFLTEATARHSLFLQRFAGGQKNRLLKYVTRVKNKVLDRIQQGNISEFSQIRLQAILRDINNFTIEIYKDMGKELTEEMIEFGKYEADFTKRMFEKGIKGEFTLPRDNVIEAAIRTNPMNVTPNVGGKTIGQTLRQFEKKAAREIIQTIKDGVVIGDTPKDIANSIRSIANNQAQNVEALVRTTTNHVATEARKATMQENEDVLEGYQVVATLDSRTTIICAGLDGKVFPLNSNKQPPFHWGCRSTLIPKVKREFDLFAEVDGERPAIGPDGAQKEVSTRTRFDGWLRDQPADFQKEYFSKLSNGEEKFKLFKKGGLKMEKFTDSRTAEYTLEELKRLEPLAFKRANVEV